MENDHRFLTLYITNELKYYFDFGSNKMLNWSCINFMMKCNRTWYPWIFIAIEFSSLCLIYSQNYGCFSCNFLKWRSNLNLKYKKKPTTTTLPCHLKTTMGESIAVWLVFVYVFNVFSLFFLVINIYMFIMTEKVYNKYNVNKLTHR